MVKQKQKTSEVTLSQVTQNVGMFLMTAAATVGMLELSTHGSAKIVVPMQPALVRVGDTEDTNPLRREREETAPHHISYSETQRTPGRSGRR